MPRTPKKKAAAADAAESKVPPKKRPKRTRKAPKAKAKAEKASAPDDAAEDSVVFVHNVTLDDDESEPGAEASARLISALNALSKEPLGSVETKRREARVCIHLGVSVREAELSPPLLLSVLSGDWSLTLLELGSLGSLVAAAGLLPGEKVNVKGSCTLKGLAAFLCTKAAVTRLYNTYLEAVFFTFPREERPLRRDMEQLQTILFHDRLTLLSQFAFNVGLYYATPGYYPPAGNVAPLHEPVLRLVSNHYLLSFGMYWMHELPFLWEKIHSYHHWAKHPLSRNTYDDHWLDNLGNAVVGHFCAQALLPLDHGTFWFSHIFRIFESLEKLGEALCCELWLQLGPPVAEVFSLCADCAPPRLASRRAQRVQLHLQLNRRSLGLRLRHAESGPGLGDAGRARALLAVCLLPVVSVTAVAIMKLQRDGFSLSQR
eukprot:s5125_g2.t1